MKALTIHQPWASAIVDGPKRVENRTWRPPSSLIGQQLAIHAGLHEPDELIIDTVQFYWQKCPVYVEDFRRGVILGVVTVTDVMDVATAWPKHRPWATGPWCWELDDVRQLQVPVPCKGRQGLWTLPEDVEAQVLEQVR